MPRPDAERQALIVWVQAAKQFADLIDVYLPQISKQGTVVSDVNITGPIVRGGSLVVPASLYGKAQGDWAGAVLTASIIGMTIPPWPFRTSFGVDIPITVAFPQYKNALKSMESALGLTPPLKYIVPAVVGAGAVLYAFWKIGKQDETP